MNTQMDKRHSEPPKPNFFSMATVVEKSPDKNKYAPLKSGQTFIPSPMKFEKADTFLESLNKPKNGPQKLQKRTTEVFVEDTESPSPQQPKKLSTMVWNSTNNILSGNFVSHDVKADDVIESVENSSDFDASESDVEKK